MEKLKKLYLSIKFYVDAAIGFLAVISGLVLYIFFKNKENEKIDSKIEELEKNIIENDAIIDYNKKNIESLSSEEEVIKDNIDKIKKEKNNEELEDFFKNRGF